LGTLPRSQVASAFPARSTNSTNQVISVKSKFVPNGAQNLGIKSLTSDRFTEQIDRYSIAIKRSFASTCCPGDTKVLTIFPATPGRCPHLPRDRWVGFGAGLDLHLERPVAHRDLARLTIQFEEHGSRAVRLGLADRE
jgi:hypothetical protein